VVPTYALPTIIPDALAWWLATPRRPASSGFAANTTVAAPSGTSTVRTNFIHPPPRGTSPGTDMGGVAITEPSTPRNMAMTATYLNSPYEPTSQALELG